MYCCCNANLIMIKECLCVRVWFSLFRGKIIKTIFFFVSNFFFFLHLVVWRKGIRFGCCCCSSSSCCCFLWLFFFLLKKRKKMFYLLVTFWMSHHPIWCSSYSTVCRQLYCKSAVKNVKYMNENSKESKQKKKHENIK